MKLDRKLHLIRIEMNLMGLLCNLQNYCNNKCLNLNYKFMLSNCMLLIIHRLEQLIKDFQYIQIYINKYLKQ